MYQMNGLVLKFLQPSFLSGPCRVLDFCNTLFNLGMQCNLSIKLQNVGL